MRRLGGRQQEHRSLEALLENGKERHGSQGEGATTVDRLACFALELPLELRGVAVHPDDHRRHEHHRDGVDDGLHHLLLGLRQGRGEQVQAHADADAEQHGQGDTDKHRADRRAVSFEEGGNNAHDERRLKAFTKTDKERADKYAEYALHTPYFCPADRDFRLSVA